MFYVILSVLRYCMHIFISRCIFKWFSYIISVHFYSLKFLIDRSFHHQIKQPFVLIVRSNYEHWMACEWKEFHGKYSLSFLFRGVPICFLIFSSVTCVRRGCILLFFVTLFCVNRFIIDSPLLVAN